MAKLSTKTVLAYLGIFAGGILLISWAYRRSNKQEGKRVSRKAKALFVGDSFTAGNNSYVEQAKQELRDLWTLKIAKEGANTEWMLQNSKDEITGGKYEVVFVWGGLNDIYATGKSDQAKANLKAIYELAQKSGAKAVAITVSPSDGYRTYGSKIGSLTTDLNNWILNNGVTDKIIDFNKMLTKDGKQNVELFESDKLHVNESGHKLLADAVIKNIFQ